MTAKKSVIYSPNPLIAEAQKLSVAHQFPQCIQKATQAISQMEGEEQGEAYLIRAQVKLFCGDESMLEDLKCARRLLPEGSTITTIGTAPSLDSAELVVVFNPEPGWLSRYKQALQRAMPLIEKLCGGMGVDLMAACEADLLYFTGYINKALEITRPVYDAAVESNSYYIAMLCGAILTRCYVATAQPDKMEEVMGTMIRYSRILSRPYLKSMYLGIKGWVNCITGWMGEIPRFIVDPSGREYAVLEERTRMINNGFSVPSPMEQSLLEAAKLAAPDMVFLKGMYGQIYQAVMNFKLGNRDEAVAEFYELYTLTQKNRIIMPFVEYGKQILPLLQYAISQKDSARFARRWSDKLNQMATQYEESLRIVRGESHPQPVQQNLLPLELDVLEKLVQEMTIAEIAQALEKPVEEIKEYIRQIYAKIGVHNRPEAVAKAVGSRIITPYS